MLVLLRAQVGCQDAGQLALLCRLAENSVFLYAVRGKVDEKILTKAVGTVSQPSYPLQFFPPLASFNFNMKVAVC
jgi:hypothetical protein